MYKCVCKRAFKTKEDFSKHFSTCQEIKTYLENLKLPTRWLFKKRLKDMILQEDFYAPSAEEGMDYVICPYCPKHFNRYKTLSKNHFSIHGKSVEEVKGQFPEIKLSRDKALEIRKKTNKELFGVEFTGQRDDIRELFRARDKEFYEKRQEKIEATCKKKYGVKNPMLTEEGKQRVVNAIKEKYGVENVMELDWVREKIKASRKVPKPTNTKYKKPAKGTNIKEVLQRTERHQTNYKNLNEKEKIKFIEKIVSYYRVSGFPYNRYNEKLFLQTIKDIKNLKLPGSNEIPAPTINQDLFQFFMPHFWECSSKGNKAPLEFWEEDENLEKLIESRLKYAAIVSDESMRRGLKIGCKTPTNFNSGIAKLLVDKYGEKDSIIYDFSAGFGGRLAGAACSEKCKKYIGIDVSKKSVKGLESLASWLKENNLTDAETIIRERNALDYIPEEPVDLIITSPPYYDKEFYSNDANQSTKLYSNYEDWFEKFLLRVVNQATKKLKKGGYLILALSNIKDCPIYDDFKKNFNALKLEEEISVIYPQIFQKNFKEKILVYKNK